ncbi:hypothetical protein H0H93_015576, partial [Arthromyces matolae]
VLLPSHLHHRDSTTTNGYNNREHDSQTKIQGSLWYDDNALDSPFAFSLTPRCDLVRLGTSGLKVSKIILGTMQYGDPEWQAWLVDEKEAIKHIKFAYENGIQTFDTANVYSNGMSEIILGKAIKALDLPREEIVILTKVYFTVGRDTGDNIVATGQAPDEIGYVNQHGLSRKHIFDSVKASLKRLDVDYIDVLQ